MSRSKLALRAVVLAGAVLAGGGSLWAEMHPTVPALSSRAGAPYTLYLDFGGFNFTGTWGSTGKTPGVVPAYAGVTTSFTSSQIGQIQETWARTAEMYSAFNINVTTVDPSVVAGKSGTDLERQAYYDSTSRVMHTFVGAQNASGTNWYGSAGGVSYVNVARNTYSTTPNGGASAAMHGNWVFTNSLGGQVDNYAAAAGHENGHALGLYHQADYVGETIQGNGYSTNNGATGNGSVAPIMGVTYNSQRGTWRIGNADRGSRFVQNDVAVLLANPGIGALIDSGKGHTLATASALPLTGTTVDYAGARGIISPLNIAGTYDAFGQANYSSDYYKFRTTGGALTLTLWDGSDWVTPGTAAPGATLNGTLTILDGLGNVVGSATEATNTLSEIYTGTLPAGIYYAKVTSNGGWLSTYDTSEYYSMGSYFLKGSGFVAIPEPGTGMILVGAIGAGLLRRGR